MILLVVVAVVEIQPEDDGHHQDFLKVVMQQKLTSLIAVKSFDGPAIKFPFLNKWLTSTLHSSSASSVASDDPSLDRQVNVWYPEQEIESSDGRLWYWTFLTPWFLIDGGWDADGMSGALSGCPVWTLCEDPRPESSSGDDHFDLLARWSLGSSGRKQQIVDMNVDMIVIEELNEQLNQLII